MSESAFPCGQPVWGGLTKRELIAAMAMQGYLAQDRKLPHHEVMADICIRYADALLAELERRK